MHACIHDVTLSYIMLHYITLHLHYITFALHYITLHYITYIHTLLYTTLQWLRCVALHCRTLHDLHTYKGICIYLYININIFHIHVHSPWQDREDVYPCVLEGNNLPFSKGYHHGNYQLPALRTKRGLVIQPGVLKNTSHVDYILKPFSIKHWGSPARLKCQKVKLYNVNRGLIHPWAI